MSCPAWTHQYTNQNIPSVDIVSCVERALSRLLISSSSLHGIADNRESGIR